MKTRYPAVSGAFYPAEPQELLRQVENYLRCAVNHTLTPEPPKMLIVPHAGYMYSGQIAADAYAHLKEWNQQIDRVILLGPSHRVPVNGMAVTESDCFATPLGEIPIDTEAIASIQSMPSVFQSEEPHLLEHSLEVQLPFLQILLNSFDLIPVVVGRCTDQQIATMLKALWAPKTLLVVSTDLSHFLYDDDAKRIDSQTVQSILTKHTDLCGEQVCGHYPLNGALYFARKQGWRMLEVSHGNSGQVTGNKERVVGYASFASYSKVA